MRLAHCRFAAKAWRARGAPPGDVAAGSVLRGDKKARVRATAAGLQSALGCRLATGALGDYLMYLLTSFVISNMSARALPNSARIFSSALIMRFCIESCSLLRLI